MAMAFELLSFMAVRKSSDTRQTRKCGLTEAKTGRVTDRPRCDLGYTVLLE